MRLRFYIFAVALFCLPAANCFADAFQLNVTYVCNGERLVVESCNIRDLSDNATCMVQHPDRPLHNGFPAYTNETRGTLNKLTPTCKQPSTDQVARAQAFAKKQQDTQESINQKNIAAMDAPTPAPYSQPQKQKSPEEREMARCISSGRLPASCTGNTLLGAFSQMITSVLPSTGTKAPSAGPVMAGVFQGAGNWRIDFIDGGVMVNCSFLSPDQHYYTLKFENNQTIVSIDTTPHQLNLILRPDGTMVGPGPLQINGVVAAGYSGGADPTSYSHGYKDQNGLAMSDGQAATGGSPVYDSLGNRVYGASAASTTGHTTFAPRTATCPALNLSTKGASVGLQTMQTDLLKTMFGGDKGAPTPPGIRMHGIYAASTGFSLEFFPESVILGCGPDAARAYPYVVVASGNRAVIQINAPDHPLTLAFRPDGSLDPGASTPYQVHGRVVTGQNDNDDFTFAANEQSCNLAVLTPSQTIPSGGGSASPAGTTLASGASSTSATNLSTTAAPLGNATLSIVSALRAPAGTANPLAGHPFVILRDSYVNALQKGGVSVPAGMSPYKYVGSVCGAGRTPDCQKILNAINTDAASAARADMNGSGTLPGVPAGTYYLMISTRYNNQSLVWGQAVQLRPGTNSFTLDQTNATPIN